MSDVKVKPDVGLMARLLVLQHVTSELAKGFGLEDVDLEIIRKGIVEQQLLRRICIYYKNQQGNIKARVILEIDWDKHELLAGTATTSMVRIDKAKSIKDQVSEIYEVIVNYIQNVKKTSNAHIIGKAFIFRDEVNNNSTEYKKALNFLNLYTMSSKEWDEIDKKTFGSHVEYQSSDLQELDIIIDHDKI